MDQNLKKKIAQVKSFIQKKEYQQALNQLEVLMYKYQKSFQVHLMSGLCYQKLNKQKQAENCYKEVLDLKEDQPNAIKSLCQIYTKRGDAKNSTIYLEKNVHILKTTDDKKYRQAIVKLIQVYKKELDLQKISVFFQQYVQKETVIGDDFVEIADAYFRIGVTNLCFNLQKFQLMGINGQTHRPVIISAREKLNILLMDIVAYLNSVAKQYNLTQKDLANSLYEMRYYFPYSPCMLMLFLLDQYCVGHVAYSSIILEQIYKLLSSYYKKCDNGYLNLQYTQPEIFTVCLTLGFQYLSFFKQFFTLDECFNQFYQDLASKQEQLMKTCKIRQEYGKKIRNFILKKCRILNQISQTSNVQNQLQQMKKRIQKLQGSFLQEVIAKMAMHSFVNYQKLDDMKNLLKVRIKNLNQGDKVPHLYKYYVDYLIKIATIYKTLDEQINIYQALEYIIQHDPKDQKYLIENQWLIFSKAMLLQNNQEKNQIAKNCIQKIETIIPNCKGALKSIALRRKCVIKVFLNDYQIQKQMKEALLLERSFQNLQILAFYEFYNKNYENCLIHLKQAFILNQSHYHTNRLIFICLFKLGFKNEAVDFVDRIKQGFRSVFWVNYILGLKFINQKKFIQAESYLTNTLEAFNAGANKSFKFSYEKTIQKKDFAFLYMIQQNTFSILFDQFIFPESVIFEHFPIASSLFFESFPDRTRIKLSTQMAQVLKVLGRTKSSLNYLSEAYSLSQSLSIQQESFKQHNQMLESSKQQNQMLELCLMKKQYATLLFYMRMFRQSQIVLFEALSDLQKISQKAKTILVEQIDSQIKSLSFQLSVERLSIMIKFESYETATQYLKYFKVQQAIKPSINYLKSKYQFYILEYLHLRESPSKIFVAIEAFLNYFGIQANLSLSKENSIICQQPTNGSSNENIYSSDFVKEFQFQDKYYSLNFQEKNMIREALQDLYVIKYISAPQKLSQSEVMPLIQLFPKSTIFYIVYGMATKDIKLKTASFLKCIQLDKQSPISIDLLASLYLKQKNYVAAAKLFLKSLEMNVLNTKCYLGLSLCLFCLIGKAVQIQNSNVVVADIIHKSLIRINSYMEYLRTVDPSQNYHLLKFLRLLTNDEHLSNFEIKTTLQSSFKSCSYKYKNTLMFNLLSQTTKQWQNYNIWQNEGHSKIIQQFLHKNNLLEPSQNYISNCHKDHQNTSQIIKIASQLIKNCKKQAQQILELKKQIKQEFFLKQLEKLLNQLAIGINLTLKLQTFNQKIFSELIQFAKFLDKNIDQRYDFELKSKELKILKKKIKSYLFEYILKNNLYSQKKNDVREIFKNIHTYDYFSVHPQKIKDLQKQLARQILLNPDCQELKRLLSIHLVINKGQNVRKGRFDYKVQLLNDTHANLEVQKQSLKKLILLYNDFDAWIGYIQICWTDPKQRSKNNLVKWLKVLNHIRIKLNEQNKTNKFSSYNDNKKLHKVIRLQIEIYSFFSEQFKSQKELLDNFIQNFSQSEKKEIEATILTNRIIQKDDEAIKIKQLKSLFFQKKNKIDEEYSHFLLLNILSHIVQKYETSAKIQNILIKIQEDFHKNNLKDKDKSIIQNNQKKLTKLEGCLLLLRFICCVNRKIVTQQDLISQVVTFNQIIQQSQKVGINKNTLTIMSCIKCLMSADYERLEQEITLACNNNKVLTYSDQLLINYFEVMRAYKEVQTNCNTEGVIQNFSIFVQNMIQLSKDPFQRGFFYSLKGLVNSMIVAEQNLREDRSLKMALMLNPYSSRSFIKS